MIELKINGDLAQYIDTDELQRTAEYEVKNQIKEAVNKMIKSDETVKQIIKTIVEEKIATTVFDESLTKIIQDRVFEVTKALSDWDIKYKADLDGKIVSITEKNKDNINKILEQKLDSTVDIYEVQKYEINSAVRDIATKYIMENTKAVNIKETLEMFVANGIDRIMEQLSY